MSDRIAEIEARLRAALALEQLEIVDDSAAHRGHAGAQGGGHYSVTLVSSRFQGLDTVKRHRLVYAALQDMMPHAIHALSIRALTPGER